MSYSPKTSDSSWLRNSSVDENSTTVEQMVIAMRATGTSPPLPVPLLQPFIHPSIHSFIQYTNKCIPFIFTHLMRLTQSINGCPAAATILQWRWLASRREAAIFINGPTRTVYACKSFSTLQVLPLPPSPPRWLSQYLCSVFFVFNWSSFLPFTRNNNGQVVITATARG